MFEKLFGGKGEKTDALGRTHSERGRDAEDLEKYYDLREGELNAKERTGGDPAEIAREREMLQKERAEAREKQEELDSHTAGGD